MNGDARRGQNPQLAESRAGIQPQASWSPASWTHRRSPGSLSHMPEPQVQLSLRCISFLVPRWRQTACRWRDRGWQIHLLPLHLTILEGLTGVHLRPHRPPPTQPTAGLLISHPVPPAPPCLSWGGLRLAPLQNGLIRINPEKAHVLFIPAKVK